MNRLPWKISFLLLTFPFNGIQRERSAPPMIELLFDQCRFRKICKLNGHRIFYLTSRHKERIIEFSNFLFDALVRNFHSILFINELQIFMYRISCIVV